MNLVTILPRRTYTQLGAVLCALIVAFSWLPQDRAAAAAPPPDFISLPKTPPTKPGTVSYYNAGVSTSTPVNAANGPYSHPLKMSWNSFIEVNGAGDAHLTFAGTLAKGDLTTVMGHTQVTGQAVSRQPAGDLLRT